MTSLRRGKRAAAATILVAGGIGVGAASWTGGQHGWAIASIVLYVVLAAVAYLWAGRSGDFAALLRGGGDERQRALDRDATAFTAGALLLLALGGALVSLGRTGNPGVYGLFCAVGALAHGGYFAVVRRRR
jgi:hypothetical protein